MKGKQYGELKVIEYMTGGVWLTECSCGNKEVKTGYLLREGKARCCRKCARPAISSQYNRWSGMMQRCYNPQSVSYKYYGGKGIEVCKEWHDHYVFSEWYEQNKPKGLKRSSIERLDNNKDYCPGNCRVIELAKQNKNKGRGEEKKLILGRTYKEWAKELGISVQNCRMRYYRYGVSLFEAYKASFPLHGDKVGTKNASLKATKDG